MPSPSTHSVEVPDGPSASGLSAQSAAGGTTEDLHAQRHITVNKGSSSGGNMSAAESKGCLCLFDIDRILTAKPGCPGSRVVAGVYDNAYGGGPMTLSVLGQGIGQTACGRCALGAVSAGSGGSGAMRSMLRGGPMTLGLRR
mmetsp:Transcript_37756/g.121436  ORF Transcript_37756/g.121436 Transcript_37756/m.121436 type:complete len:142 (+) Transcript_37756:182-607(+)